MKPTQVAVAILTFSCLGAGAFADLPGPPAGAGASRSFLPGEDVDDASGAPSVPGPLTIVGDRTKPMVPNVAFHDFGVLGMPTAAPIQHDFIVHNRGNAPLTIDRAEPGCECTTASVGDGAPGPHFLAPNHDLTIHATIDSKQLYVGKINKIVWIYFSGQPSPAYTLHLIGRTIPIATLTPDMLTFGALRAGQTLPELLTVSADTMAYGAHPPDPFSIGGAVKIIRASAKATVAGSRLIRTYRVILAKNARPGRLSDVIAMPMASDLSRPGPSILISGIVIGRKDPKPSP